LLGAAAPAHAALTVNINDVAQSETNGDTTFAFAITGTTDATPFPGGGSVTATTSDNTAVAGGGQPGHDYDAKSESFTINAIAANTVNAPIGTFNVTVHGDATFELNDQFVVTLSNITGTGAAIGDGSGTGTIQNDDARPDLVFADPAAQAEGNAGASPYNFPVTLTNATYLPVAFQATTIGGSATSAPAGPGNPDFTEILDQTFTIPAGATSVNVPVQVNGDTILEGNETLAVRFTNFTNQLVAVNLVPGGVQQTNGQINNDDTAPTFTISALTTELCETDNPIQITVTLSAPSGLPATVTLTTGGTATAGTDYTLAPLVLNFAPGETVKTATLDPAADLTLEGAETIVITAVATSGVTGPNQVLPTITLNDPDDRNVFLEKISGGDTIGLNGNPLQVFRATVTDGCGDPVPFAEVTFHVNGSTGSDQDVTVIANSQGEAQFSYPPLFPGTDDVTASVDNLGQTFTSNLISTDFTIGSNTPNAAVDGHGNTDAAEASGPTGLLTFFSLNVRNLRNNRTSGAVNATLPVAGAITLRSLKINHLIAGQGLPDGKKALMFGTAKLLVQVGGPGMGIRTVLVPVSIRVDALDNGNPGVPNDRFEVTFLVQLTRGGKEAIAGGLLPAGTFTAGGNVVGGKNGVPGNINIRNGLATTF